MRLVVIHQPHFLPWLGYFNKLANADVFVIQDTLQFRQRYYQNRTLIKNAQGKSEWITVPVSVSLNTSICDVEISDVEWKRTKKKLEKTLYYAYKHTEYYIEYLPQIWQAIDDDHGHKLLSLNSATLRAILQILALNELSIVHTSQFNVSNDPTQRLIDICYAVGINNMIVGEGEGLQFHDLNKLRDFGINVIKQNFKEHHPVYSQVNGEFISGLSVIDALFNIGADETARIIRRAWSIK